MITVYGWSTRGAARTHEEDLSKRLPDLSRCCTVLARKVASPRNLSLEGKMRGEFRKSVWMLMVGALTAMVVGVWPGSASGASAQGEAFLDKTVSFSTSVGGAVRPASDKVNTAVATFDSLPEGPPLYHDTDGRRHHLLRTR